MPATCSQSKLAGTFYYRMLTTPNPTASNEAEALLRKQAQDKETDRQNRTPSYQNRPNSQVQRQVHGQPSLAWIADYESDGGKWCEYLVRVLGKNSVALLFLNAPANQIEALRPAMDAMAETVQLP